MMPLVFQLYFPFYYSQGSGNLDHIQILKKSGGLLSESYLEDGFLLDKKIGVGQPRRIEKAKILVANTSMDTDKIKIYGSKVKVDSLFKVSEIEEAEKACITIGTRLEYSIK